MAERERGDLSAVRVLVGLAASAVVLAATRQAAAVLIPLLIALVITVIAAPAIPWLTRRGVRSGIAFVLTALGVFAVIAAFVLLTYVSLSDFLHSLPTYGPALDTLVAQVYSLAESTGFHLLALVPAPRPAQSLPAIAAAARSVLASVTSGWLLVATITMFMLYESRTFMAKLNSAIHDKAQVTRIEQFGTTLGRSMGVLTFTNLIVGVANGIVLLALGVPGALLWASLSFLLSYIPNVGFIISVIPPTTATLLHSGPLAALFVLSAFIVINGVIDEILYPRLLGERLDLAPFWTLTSLVFWGWLLGPAGAILAVPLTLTVKLLLDSFESTRPLGVMLTTGRRQGAG